MDQPYIQVIVMLHAAFGGVFFFLNRQRRTNFARLMAWSWAIEAVRAAMLLPGISDTSIGAAIWYGTADQLCLVANACLVAGCADLTGVRLPWWLGRWYFGASAPLIFLGRFVFPELTSRWFDLPLDRARFLWVTLNLVVMFVPVAASRIAITAWLYRIWRRTLLPGALVAAIFCVPYALFALASPIQHHLGYLPSWIALAWAARVLGFSVGLLMLQFSLQLEALQRSKAGLSAAQATARLGSWELIPGKHEAAWSVELFLLFDLAPSDEPPAFASLLPRIESADRAAFEENFVRRISASGGHRGEYRVIRHDGKLRWIEARNSTINDADGSLRCTGTMQDITEKKLLEEQFLRAQRVENLGLLAAGIAHDLNNILTPVLMVGPMLRDRVTDPSDRTLLGTIEKSAERGAALAGQLLSFVHGSGGQRVPLQPQVVLREVANLMAETFPKSIRVEQHFDLGVWPVVANVTQLHQVVLNLCVNARDAMPAGGTVTLRISNQTLEKGPAGVPEARGGRFVVIEVADTGAGIAAENLERIWEPFFSSKKPGKGTGLGLATVRKIVSSHEGFCTVESHVGAGSAFRVYLPPARDEVEPKVDARPTAAYPRGNNEMILIVDDELDVRNFAGALLTNHGFRVLTAADGTEGRAVYSARATEIALVLTDWHMPEPGAEPFAASLRREFPHQRVVVMSGLPEPEFASFERAGAFLPKPFKPFALLEAVDRSLHSGQS
ncbi:MAG TPA: ATP-binding protein [Candidatus Didemnitutus sp.]|nr:ATP-binding protein [Candidatus Didemnitutus sp.]